MSTTMNSHPTPHTRRHPLPTVSSIAGMLCLLVRMALLLLLGGGQLAHAQAGAPVPTISSPLQGAKYSALSSAATLNYSGSTTIDAGAKIVKLEVYDGTRLIRSGGAVTTLTFALGTALGKHRVELRATDSLKRVGSAFVDFEVIAAVAPTVRMTAPSAGQSFAITSGVTVPVTVSGDATAFNDARITRIDVMEGAVSLGNALGDTINAVVPLDLGPHILHLRATDGIGKTTTTTPVTVNVTAPAPTAVFTSPAPNSIELAADKTATVELTGVATVDPAAAVATLEVWEGTVRKFYASNKSPNLAGKVVFPLGPHSVEFRVTDNRGMTAKAYTNFTVQAALPATVTMTAPRDGSSFALTSALTVLVPVSASARGAGAATIEKIEVLDNNVPRLTVDGDSVNDAVPLAYGPHVVKLRVTDSIGKVTLSEPVDVLVTAPDPAPELTLPVKDDTYLTPTATANVLMNGKPNLSGGAMLRMVEFYEGGKRIYITPTAVPPANPIVPTMNVRLAFAVGLHTVEARVTDSRNKKGSDVVTFTVADAPPALLAMSSPANGASFAITAGTMAGVPFKATARSVSSATIARIDVLEGARVVHTVKGDSLDELVDLPLGEHKLQLRVVDSVNKMTLGEELNISVTAPAPEPSFAAPDPDSIFLAPIPTGAIVELVGLANLAPGAGVSRLEFKENATVFAVSAAASATLTSKRTFTIGKHTVDFNVTDNRGMKASTSISFEVVPASPAIVTLAAPLDGSSYPVSTGTTGPVQLTGGAVAVGEATIAKLEVLDTNNRIVHTALKVDKLDITLNLAAGKHALQIRATDSVGKVALSTLANIIMTVPAPIATLDGPDDGSKYFTAGATANVTISGSGTAYNGSTIGKIELLDGGQLIASSAGRLFNQVKPLAVGRHALQLRSYNSLQQTALSEAANIEVVAATVGNDAQFVSQTVPAAMRAGQPYNVVVKMRNTGTLAWQDAGGYRLGAQNPADSRTWISTGRAHVSGVVATDQVATFTIPVTAPSKPGSYNFQWKMVKEGAGWFGANTENLVVVVAAGAGPSASLQVSPSNVRMVGSTPATLSFSGSGAEPGRKIVRLDLYRDAGDGYGAAVNTIAGGTASLSLNVKRNETGGVYRYKLRSTDDLGVSTDSEPVLVNVTDSPLLGMVKGVRIDAQNKPQLVGWMCQAGISQPLVYQVLLDAPTVATNGIVLTSGTANLGDEPDSANVEAQCGTPGAKHFFSVDLSAYTGEYSGRSIYVQAKPGPVVQAPAARSAMRAQGGRSLAQAQGTAPAAQALAAAAADVPPAVMPCEDRTCTMPGSLRIALTTPGKSEKFLAPATVFMSAQLSGGEGPYDEVAFAVDGQWSAGAPDTVVGRYFASQKDLAARTTPYLIQAKVRQGDMTIFSETRPILIGAAPVLTLTPTAPKDGAKYGIGVPITLSVTAVDSATAIQSVKFYANDALIGVALNGSGSWIASWTATIAGPYVITSRAFDGKGVQLLQSAAANIVVSTDPIGGGDPIAIAIDVPYLDKLDAGTLPGSLNVGSNGKASYDIALVVPPGTAGVQPSLSLNYSGASPNGLLGLGWSLSGLSSIQRCGKTIAQDGVNGRISFDHADRLCLDGQRLVLVNQAMSDDNYWSDNAEYRTEIESFSRVKTQKINGLRSFRVEAKDGRIMTYGSTETSYVKAILGSPNSGEAAKQSPPQEKTGPQSWALDSVVDRMNNYVSFVYEQDKYGEHRPKFMRYGGNGMPAHAGIVFDYEERSDIWTRYIDETRNDLRMRLSRITTYVGSNLNGEIATGGSKVREYTLAYEQSPTSGRSLLNAVKVCARNPQTSAMECLPETSFSWGKPDPLKKPGFASKGAWPGAPVLTTWNRVGGRNVSTNHADYFAFSDFENHGFTDVLEKRVASPIPADDGSQDSSEKESRNKIAPGTLRAKYRYFHNTGNAFSEHEYNIDVEGSHPEFVVLNIGDFNGDGAPDLLVDTSRGAKVCLSPLGRPEGAGTAGSMITFVCNGQRALGQNKDVELPYVVDIVGDGRSAYYGSQIRSGGAEVCWSKGCVVDKNAPNYVISSGINLPQELRSSLRDHVAMTEMVDFAGVGKPYEVRWSETQMVDKGDPSDSGEKFYEWKNPSGYVAITGFGTPDGSSPIANVLGYAYPENKPCIISLSCQPYYFDTPSLNSGLSADFNGSGQSGLVFGYAGQDSTGVHLKLPDLTVCLSTGRALDCRVRQKYSGSDYASVLAVGNFIGDGQPSILVGTVQTLAGGYQHRTGDLQMCRLLGDDTSGGTSKNDSNIVCEPWSGVKPPLNPTSDLAARDQVYFMDLLGTGRMQLVYYHVGQFDGNNELKGDYWELLEPIDLAKDKEALDQVVSVKNGLGLVSSVEFVDGVAAGVVGAGRTGVMAYPMRAVTSPNRVVGKLRTGTGAGADRTMAYQYLDGAMDLSGRGLLGFAKVITTDEQSSIVTTTEYSQAWPFNGMVKSSKAVWNGVTLTDVQNAPMIARPVPQANGSSTSFPYVEQSKAERRDLDSSELGTTLTQNHYDDWGNLDKQTVTSSASDGAVFINDTATNFRNDGARWLLGLPTSIVKTRTEPLATAVARALARDYDPVTGLLSSEVQQPGDPKYQLTTSYDRSGNAFGLVGTVTQTWFDPYENVGKSRTLSAITYDANGRFISTLKNAAGHQETHFNDPATGARTMLVGPNALATRWEVDGFGQARRELRADGNETRTYSKQCDFSCPVNAAMVQINDTFHGTKRSGVPKMIYADAAGHPLRSQTWGFDGRIIVADATYDSWGRLSRSDRPHFADETAQMDNLQGYDELSRVVSVTTIDEAGRLQEAKTEYRGFKTVLTNARQFTRTELRNVVGQMKKVTDAKNGVVEFDYDPFDNLRKTIDAKKNVITVEYDLLGRKIELRDPDLGWIGYKVDPLGRTWSSTTPRQRASQQSTRTEFDVLDRMIGRYETDLESHWVFDTAPTGVGQLAEAYTQTGQGRDYDRVHTYDDSGRPFETTQQLSDAKYTSRTEYDAWGRVAKQTYQRGADGAKVFGLRYNGFGYLARLERGDLVLWEVSSQDAAQRPTRVALGNGLTQSRDFNPVTGLLENGTLQTVGAALRLQEGYHYDVLGNVQSRSQFWDGVGFHEEFSYDALNRLESSTVAQTKQVFEYDAVGNFTRKSNVGAGAYQYGPAGGKAADPHAPGPNAVLGIPGIAGAFEYDDNGNLLKGAGREASWFSFDMPEWLKNGTSKSSFVYGPEHQRVRQERSDGTKLIYAGAQEVENRSGPVTVKTYWPMGIGMEVEREGGATELNWIHLDRLGSPIAISDQGGNVVEKLAYDAWGKRRQLDGRPVNGTATPDSIDGKVDNRGFTGHEMLDQLDLVHMNGRVYDPLIGKFLSADPLVTDPFDGQNYNRYSYVLNNPTNLTDPSGFCYVPTGSSICKRTGTRGGDPVTVISDGALSPNRASDAKSVETSPSATGNYHAEGSVNAKNFGAANNAPATQSYIGMGEDGVPYRYEGPAAEPKSTSQKIKDGVGDFVEGAMHAAEGIPGEGIAFAGVVRITRAANSTVIGALERGASGLSGLWFGEMRTALMTAQDSYKGSTVIGHALSKHAGRNPQIWGRISGSMKTWNDQAMKQFREIVRAPGEFQEKAYDGIKFLEKRLEDGRGVRLNMDSTFKGFID
ncbi:Ig-like domain-containing protein [Rugamonas sp. CCM 8940]|uniref:Ig-like domain-containing protein n=1 Tax=Rugamonas sp. CCM 8940 TaxID=2765359 RepID=UPI0018F3F88A|nr:Ig-like domain-containing protein [Rugamonas sp. CCM 8940]MBJ7311490.1 hypothetical protein [Rugamonas sp. CCM 8940]